MEGGNAVPHYSMRTENSFMGSPLHDLNTVDGISDVDRDAVVSDGTLENGDETNSADCLHRSYRNTMTLGVDEEQSSLENIGGSSRTSYDILTVEDVVPIESARARFLQVFVDHFISQHVVEVGHSCGADYGRGQDKFSKRKSREVQYEGDASFVLPLMYIANLYETLVSEVNARLTSLGVVREKTIGVALEAAGGLYRRLATKFPRKGHCSFKRRELATSLETRTRFPELVVQEEKRVRFVVVNGLAIVEKPNSLPDRDVEWFKRLTGRNEVSVSARDYKFYSPRHKYRRVASPSASHNTGLPTYPCADGSSTLGVASAFRPVNEAPNQQQTLPKHHTQSISEPQFVPLQQSIHQSESTPQFSHVHLCSHASQLSEISSEHQASAISQHMCMQSLSGDHATGRLHLTLTTPAKFCDQCGTPYLRESSKYCSECGVKRLGI